MTQKTYDPKTFTYGCELELSNVSRRLVIPPHLGTWEHAERDIVNTKPPWRGVAADPLGESPPVGGEVNTVPTRGWQGQLDKIRELVTWFCSQGEIPDISPTAHHHVHVHVPGLTEDIEALKRLTAYVYDNQADMFFTCGRFRWEPDMPRKARDYLEKDGARLMPRYIEKNILEMAENFDDFIRLHCCGKDGVSRGRPFRYGVNMYCLKHTQTIEFRMFRGTLDPFYLANAFRACEMFVDAALNAPHQTFMSFGAPREDFAPMLWDKELWDGLQRTKHPEGRGKKERKHVRVE